VAVWDLRLHGEPGGPPSITGTARSMLAIFYTVTTFLSGHTPPRLLTGMTLRRFGPLACTTSPEDLPPSLAQHGSCWRSSTSSSRSFQDTPRPNVPFRAQQREQASRSRCPSARLTELPSALGAVDAADRTRVGDHAHPAKHRTPCQNDGHRHPTSSAERHVRRARV
jgi:hypothetical protein